MKQDLQKKIHDVRAALQEKKIDGWLLYDFRRTNDLACAFLEIPVHSLLTRRFFYWIPQQGEPLKIVHAIEPYHLDHLPGRNQIYRSWKDLEDFLSAALAGSKKIAMEYSPRNAVPYVSKVDGGTIDLVRECGVDVVSSADLLQKSTSVWTANQFQMHLEAAKVLDNAVCDAWHLIASNLHNKQPISEYQVQQFIMEQFAKNNCVSDDPPICAVNGHAADPHYTPSKEKSSLIQSGDFVLIDLWCKKSLPDAVYADITRVGVAASKPTKKQQEIFDIVKKARDTAVELVKNRFGSREVVMGWEVDEVCRQVIVKAGYGDYFPHRTGHSIGMRDHGDGANIDNLETRDQRQLLPGTCFSIEPGIYLPGEFGVRLEYDVYIHPDGVVEITGGVQESLKLIV